MGLPAFARLSYWRGPKGKNLDRLADIQRPVTFVADHASIHDAGAIAKCLPGNKRIVLASSDPMSAHVGRLPAGCRVSALGLDAVAEAKGLLESGLEEGESLVVFAETRPSDTGEIGKVGAIAAQLAQRLTGGRCVPVSISLDSQGMPESLTCGEPVTLKPPDGIKGAALRDWQEASLRRMLEQARFDSFDIERTLPRLLVDSARRFGMSRMVYGQVIPERREISYRLLLRGAFAIGSFMAARHAKGERVGLMLPTAVGASVAFHACHFAGVVPVLLNFGAGDANLVSACHTAQVKDVYTSSALLEKLEDARKGAEAMEGAGCAIHHLEDVRDSLGLKDKLRALFGSLMPDLFLSSMQGGSSSASEEAMVLFTSGSEGPPKGVVLSHRNVVANVAQVLARISPTRDDLLFNSLPLFHSFGMIGGLILPVAAGLRTLQFPSPLMYREIPAVIQSERATIIFSTSTFYSQYGKHAHPSDLNTLRLIIAGGEQLKESVRTKWLEKFGKRIHEGYGVTETSPALAVNVDCSCKAGTIGTFLPGVEHSIEPVEGVEEGGSLVITGPNVMSGYLLSVEPGVLKPPPEGRHDTGDVATVDELGFVRIVGRVKRFAKVAGEMVPLGRVEDTLSQLSGDEPSAVISLPDEGRGEKIVLLTQAKGVTREQAQERIKESGLPELWAPREIRELEQIPLLATGKVDYPKLGRIISEGTDVT